MELSELITARICHDLISPLGAIGNGVELLEMAQTTTGPELALISQSVQQAHARVRLFRIAFGAARDGQTIGAEELRAILRDYAGQARFDLEWTPGDSTAKPMAKLAFLCLLCMETAFPFGGVVTCDVSGTTLLVTGRSEKPAIDHDLWAPLATQAGWPDDLRPARVQFPVLRQDVTHRGATLTLDLTDKAITLRIAAA